MPPGGRAPKQIVKQSTIDDMKRMGMSKAIERANSGEAGQEFEEGARRMYGKRIRPKVQSSPTVTKTAETPKYVGPQENKGGGPPAPKGSGHVYGEAPAKKEKKPTINQRFRKAVLGKSDKVKLF